MTSSKQANSSTALKETDENCPNKYQEDFYVKVQCHHEEKCDIKPEVKASPTLIFKASEEVEALEENFTESVQIREELNSQSEDDFRDRECGEPITTQHLKIDFTPIDGEDDNVILQKKCVDFWKLIEKHSELHKFKVFPETAHRMSKTSLNDSKELLKDISTPAINYLRKEDAQISDALAMEYGARFSELERGEYSISDQGKENKRTGRKKRGMQI